MTLFYLMGLYSTKSFSRLKIWADFVLLEGKKNSVGKYFPLKSSKSIFLTQVNRINKIKTSIICDMLEINL